MFDVKVVDLKSNTQTGLKTVYVVAEQKTGNGTRTGPVKGYAIEADTLIAHYNGKLANWLQWVKSEHQRFHGMHDSMEEELKAMVGKIL